MACARVIWILFGYVFFCVFTEGTPDKSSMSSISTTLGGEIIGRSQNNNQEITAGPEMFTDGQISSKGSTQTATTMKLPPTTTSVKEISITPQYIDERISTILETNDSAETDLPKGTTPTSPILAGQKSSMPSISTTLEREIIGRSQNNNQEITTGPEMFTDGQISLKGSTQTATTIKLPPTMTSMKEISITPQYIDERISTILEANDSAETDLPKGTTPTSSILAGQNSSMPSISTTLEREIIGRSQNNNQEITAGPEMFTDGQISSKGSTQTATTMKLPPTTTSVKEISITPQYIDERISAILEANDSAETDLPKGTTPTSPILAGQKSSMPSISTTLEREIIGRSQNNNQEITAGPEMFTDGQISSKGSTQTATIMKLPPTTTSVKEISITPQYIDERISTILEANDSAETDLPKGTTPTSPILAGQKSSMPSIRTTLEREIIGRSQNNNQEITAGPEMFTDSQISSEVSTQTAATMKLSPTTTSVKEISITPQYIDERISTILEANDSAETDLPKGTTPTSSILAGQKSSMPSISTTLEREIIGRSQNNNQEITACPEMFTDGQISSKGSTQTATTMKLPPTTTSVKEISITPQYIDERISAILEANDSAETDLPKGTTPTSPILAGQKSSMPSISTTLEREIIGRSQNNNQEITAGPEMFTDGQISSKGSTQTATIMKLPPTTTSVKEISITPQYIDERISTILEANDSAETDLPKGTTPTSPILAGQKSSMPSIRTTLEREIIGRSQNNNQEITAGPEMFTDSQISSEVSTQTAATMKLSPTTTSVKEISITPQYIDERISTILEANDSAETDLPKGTTPTSPILAGQKSSMPSISTTLEREIIGRSQNNNQEITAGPEMFTDGQISSKGSTQTATTIKLPPTTTSVKEISITPQYIDERISTLLEANDSAKTDLPKGTSPTSLFITGPESGQEETIIEGIASSAIILLQVHNKTESLPFNPSTFAETTTYRVPDIKNEDVTDKLYSAKTSTVTFSLATEKANESNDTTGISEETIAIFDPVDWYGVNILDTRTGVSEVSYVQKNILGNAANFSVQIKMGRQTIQMPSDVLISEDPSHLVINFTWPSSENNYNYSLSMHLNESAGHNLNVKESDKGESFVNSVDDIQVIFSNTDFLKISKHKYEEEENSGDFPRATKERQARVLRLVIIHAPFVVIGVIVLVIYILKARRRKLRSPEVEDKDVYLRLWNKTEC